MSYNRVCISSGHSTKCQGAIGILNEVEEATRVVNHVADELGNRGVDVVSFSDTVSTSQNENLNRIVDWHNSHARDLDISVHFNAYVETEKPMGTEVLYVTQSSLAAQVSAAIADVGFINRGAKKRTDLFFLNNTAMPAILIEVCFVDSQADADLYRRTFDNICANISNVIGGEDHHEQPPHEDASLHLTGKCSWFGGPGDSGVAPDEGLAFISDVMQKPELFLPYQPDNTSGLARRLNPFVHFVAARWDYDKQSREQLLQKQAIVRALKTGIELRCFPADWGPNQNTGRVCDLSPSLMTDLGITTDDEVELIWPAPEQATS